MTKTPSLVELRGMFSAQDPPEVVFGQTSLGFVFSGWEGEDLKAIWFWYYIKSSPSSGLLRVPLQQEGESTPSTLLLFHFSSHLEFPGEVWSWKNGAGGAWGSSNPPLIPSPADSITLTLMEVPKIHLQQGFCAPTSLLFTLSIKSLSSEEI